MCTQIAKIYVSLTTLVSSSTHMLIDKGEVWEAKINFTFSLPYHFLSLLVLIITTYNDMNIKLAF